MKGESPEEFLARTGIREVRPPPNRKKSNGATDNGAELRKNTPPRGPNGVFHGTFPRQRSMEHLGKTEYIPAYQRELKVLDAAQLLTMKFPPRNLIMSPWLPEKGLAQIYAPRGVGKTWAALGIAHAVASGGQFLRWSAKSARRVLYIDGEMPMSLLKERYAMVVASAMTEAPPQNFRMLAADYQQDGLPDLADTDAQKFYEGVIADADLIILDNYSTLARGLKENDADSFGAVQGWLLAQRAAGRSVLAAHHAGKGGGQRGTSKKEDTLDTVISLGHPPGYAASEGARFEIRFTKNRGFWGEDASPFEARFVNGQWTTSEIASDDSDDSLRALRDEGLSFREIAARTGVPIASLHRRLKEGES
jgi:hypothetical protein